MPRERGGEERREILERNSRGKEGRGEDRREERRGEEREERRGFTKNILQTYG